MTKGPENPPRRDLQSNLELRSLSDQEVFYSLKLDNGIDLEVLSIPTMGTTECAIECPIGTLHEPQGKEELAHLTEHVVAPRLDLPGVKTNARTSCMDTTFTLSCLPSQADSAIREFADRLYSADLSPQRVEKERNVIRAEHAGHRPIWDRLLGMLLHAQFGSGNLEGLSTVEPLVSAEDVQDFYTRYFQESSPPRVTLAGVVNESTLELVRGAFSEITLQDNGKPFAIPEGLSDPIERIIVETQREDPKLAYLGMVTQLPVDLFGSPAMEIAHNMVYDSSVGEMIRELRHKRGLTYDTPAFKTHYAKGTGLSFYQDRILIDNYEEVRDGVLEVRARLFNNGVSEREIEAFKLRTALNVTRVRFGDCMLPFYALEARRGKPFGPDAYVKGIHEATSNEIQEAVKAIVSPDHLSSVLLLPEQPSSRRAFHRWRRRD